MSSLSRFLTCASGLAIASSLFSPVQSLANDPKYGANKDVGYEVYQLQQQIRATETRVTSLEKDLEKMRGELALLGSKKATPSAGTHPVSYQGKSSQSSPPPSGDGIQHRVERGDTLSSISRRYRVGIDRIVAANRISNPHALRIGQEIFVPGVNSSSPSPSSSGTKSTPPKPSASSNKSQQPAGYYTVQAGDTLYSIARKHGTSIDTVVGMNQMSNPNSLSIGQQLKVPGASGSKASPAPSSSGGKSKSPAPSGGTGKSGGNLQNGTADSGDMIQAPSGHGFYQVEPKDNLHSIAISFETTTKNLRELNELNSDSIRVGQYLLVPVPDDSLYED